MHRALSAVFATGLLLAQMIGLASGASADDTRLYRLAEVAAMRFDIVAAPPVCPGCVVINAVGEVTPDTSRDFARFIAEARLKGLLPPEPRRGAGPPDGAPKVILALSSDGGNVTPALVIGRRIRELGWSTIVGQGLVEDGVVRFDTAGCYSACSMMMLGGVERLVLPRSIAGVHQFSPSFEESETFSAADMEEIIRDYGRTVTMVYDYVAEMGVDISFFVTTLRTPFASMRILSPNEWIRVGIATRQLPDNASATLDDLVSVGMLPSAAAAGLGTNWTITRLEGGEASAVFTDAERGSLLLSCVARDRARLELTLRGLSSGTLERVRRAAATRKRLRIGEREVAIDRVAPTIAGQQTLGVLLDLRDLNALRAAEGRVALAVVDRAGTAATTAFEIDASEAAAAIAAIMGDCGRG